MRRFLPLTLPALAALLAGCASPAPVTAPEPPGSAPDAPFVFAVEPPPTFRTEGVRLATFNGEFLFDGEGDEGQATFPWKGDPAAARAHRADVARVIRMLDADVVLVPETENLRALELMIEESLADLGYTPYLVNGTDRFTGQDVGLLSRVPVDTVFRTDERVPVAGTSELYGVSKNLVARLTLAGVPTTLIGVHFLAQPDNVDRKPRREAQAEVIRRAAAREAAAGRAVVVLGDLNDFDGETPDVKGSAPITDVIAHIKAVGDGPADDLRNVMAEVDQRRRFTALWDRNGNGTVDDGELSAIDHVLLGPELYRRMAEVTFVHSHDPTAVSDHFPIVVTLRPN